MLLYKENYFLFTDNTTELNLNAIKIKNKFIVIYRNNGQTKNFSKLKRLRKECKKKFIKFYVANDTRLYSYLKADGLYISAHNKDLRLKAYNKSKIKNIGSAHNLREISLKIKQGCKTIVFSRLFETSYRKKSGHLGTVKFNLLTKIYNKQLIPLGGIRYNNLNKLKIINSNGLCILSELKKKPAKIINRLF